MFHYAGLFLEADLDLSMDRLSAVFFCPASLLLSVPFYQ